MEKVFERLKKEFEEGKLDKYGEIVYIDLNYKTVKGKRTGTKAIVFGVEKKKTIKELKESNIEIIPAKIDNFPTDVVEVHKIVITDKEVFESFYPDLKVESKDEDKGRKERHDVVQPGISEGHPDITAGSTGWMPYSRKLGKLLCETNWHVGCGETGKVGDKILQPGKYDGGHLPEDEFAELIWAIDPDGTSQDVCLQSPTTRTVSQKIYDGLLPAGEPIAPEIDMNVAKSGRTSGITRGIIKSTNATVRVWYGTRFRVLHDIILTTFMLKGGDSGSPMYSFKQPNINDYTPIGRSFAGSDTVSCFCRLDLFVEMVRDKYDLVYSPSPEEEKHYTEVVILEEEEEKPPEGWTVHTWVKKKAPKPTKVIHHYKNDFPKERKPHGAIFKTESPSNAVFGETVVIKCWWGNDGEEPGRIEFAAWLYGYDTGEGEPYPEHPITRYKDIGIDNANVFEMEHTIDSKDYNKGYFIVDFLAKYFGDIWDAKRVTITVRKELPVEGAEVDIDGVVKLTDKNGYAKHTGLSEGKHTKVIRKAGFKEFRKEFELG